MYQPELSDDQIKYLNFLFKSYERVNKTSAQIQQMCLSLVPDMVPKKHFIISGEDDQKGLTSLKGAIGRKIQKELSFFLLWTEWLQNIEGVGPVTAAPLILKFHYKFVAICTECGADLVEFKCPACEAPQSGLLQHRIEKRDFPNVSSWWKFCGRHVSEGAMPKRKKGEKTDWSTDLRTTTYHIGQGFNRRPDSYYGAFLRERKAYREKTHPNATKGHKQNMACNEAVKLFLSHFWHVGRELQGKETTQPYAIQILNHTGYIEPPEWVSLTKLKNAA